ncbi:MAG: pilus assembly protein PilM [Phycisphaerae bacterium]|nr:pilus assembly protein PilM [Phycisphaerae bacterium]
MSLSIRQHIDAARRLLGNNAGPIGLDLGHDAIRMIQLAFAADRISVIAAQETDIPHDLPDAEAVREFTVRALRKMLGDGGFSGREVVSCLSNDRLRIKSLRLDTTDPVEIELQLKTEVAQRFGLNADRDEIRYMIAGSVYQGDEIKNEVIFFGMDNESITDHLSLLEEAGLIPVAIDAVPCALFRSFQASLRRQEDQCQVSVLVNVEELYTTVLIARGQEIIFVKQIAVAAARLTAEVASRLHVTADEAKLLRAGLKANADSVDPATRQAVIDAMSHITEELAKEISLCFRYYAVTFRGQRPTEVVFAGGETDETTLLNALRRHLGVDVTVARPLRGIEMANTVINRRRNIEMSEWAVAVGLGMKGMDASACGTEDYERN